MSLTSEDCDLDALGLGASCKYEVAYSPFSLSVG